MDYKAITDAYYSKWLGQCNVITESDQSVFLLYSKERDRAQPGYSSQFDLWILVFEGQIFVSYGRRAEDRINRMEFDSRDNDTATHIVRQVASVYNKTPVHGIKYQYCRRVPPKGIAVKLDRNRYEEYLVFFKTLHPRLKEYDWLYEYYHEMVDQKACCGVFVDNFLVCCSDNPQMPYMSDQVQEIGINTLQQYRGMGYAKDTCALCVQSITEKGLCPQWSTEVGNGASQRLAERVGFSRYAEYIALTL